MWTAESPKKTKFRIVLEAEFQAEDVVSESLCAKITQKALDEYRPELGKIRPNIIKVIQVEEQK